jgi:hypothetical protein
MSKVVTAEGSELPGSPASLREFWRLNIEGSSLKKVRGFQIASQQPVPNALSVNKLFGGVDGLDLTDKLTVFSLVDGVTEVVGNDGQVQQLVSFEIIVEGERYGFYNGVLNVDGLMITGGAIIKYTHDSEADGTWSATASGGPPTEKPGKGKGREQGHLRS